jgi:hypothetical protein
MRKLAILGALALATVLSGCNTLSVISGAAISPQSADVAINSFDVLEASATAYLSLPTCGAPGATVVCKNLTAAAKIIPAVKSGRVARDQILALLNANSGAAIPVATYNTLEAVITTLQGVNSAYNIQTK